MATISKGKLRKNYSSFEEFEAYSAIYGLHSRLGYKSPKTAWASNPLIQWSTNPADYKKVTYRKKRFLFLSDAKAFQRKKRNEGHFTKLQHVLGVAHPCRYVYYSNM